MPSQTEDKFLVAQSRLGQEAAFAKLYDKYVNGIYRFIAFRVGREEEAQDLTGEVFLRTWEYLSGKERQIDNFKALLYRIAGNLVVDYYRERAVGEQQTSEVAWERIIDWSFNLEEHIEKREAAEQIYRALQELPPGQRELVLLKYVDDLSVREMSRLLGKNAGAIRVALHRALKSLKEILKR